MSIDLYPNYLKMRDHTPQRQTNATPTETTENI